MELLIIFATIGLIVLTIFLGFAYHDAKTKVAKFERQFEHQRQELRKAALINEKLRGDVRDWREIAYKYAKDADRMVGKMQSTPTQFTKDELNTLLQLCHPDKHGGKESATRITQTIIRIRGVANK